MKPQKGPHLNYCSFDGGLSGICGEVVSQGLACSVPGLQVHAIDVWGFGVTAFT